MPTSSLRALPLIVLLLMPLPARADFAHWAGYLDQSTLFADGTYSYGFLSSEADNGQGSYHLPSVKAGQVQFQFSVMDFAHSYDHGAVYIYGPPWSLPQAFGLDVIGFNSAVSLSPSQITLPTGWTLSQHGVLGGFGTFDWVATATDPAYRSRNVMVLIDGLGTAADFHTFANLSAGGPEGAANFVGHVAGYPATAPNGFSTDHWIGGAIAASPEPSALALAGLGAAGLFLQGWARSKGARLASKRPRSAAICPLARPRRAIRTIGIRSWSRRFTASRNTCSNW